MPTYRLQVEYDGAAYHGWQVQPDVPTVQGSLDRALGLLLREGVHTVGAGRTDQGVHARGQVASFRCAGRIQPARAVAGITGICGASLRVRAFEEAPESFHARHSALWREYSYRLLEHPSSCDRHRAWCPPLAIRMARLRETTKAVLGAHDFTSFANRSDDPVDPTCTIERADWEAWEGGLRLFIRADHFLYRMVRTLVATLIHEARPGGDGAAGIERILSARQRAVAAPPAPAQGLCLEAVGYDPPWPSG